MNEVLAPAQQPALVTMQLTSQQQAWAGIPLQKNALTEDLTRRELVAQGLLQQAEEAGENWNTIDTNLAAYRKAFQDMKDARLPFTGMIQERIIAPLMEFEKRVDPKGNAKYNELFNRSVDIRRKENLKAQEANAREQEKASFNTHVTNEYNRMVGLYQATVRNEANNIYASYLRSKIQEPALVELKTKLGEIPVPPVNKFQARYLTQEQMQELFQAIKYPDWEGIYGDLMKEVDTLFSNYSSDLANAEAAIKAQETATALATQKAEEKSREGAAINTLVQTASTPIIEGPKIKKTLKVVVKEDWMWAKAVMAAFIVNLPNMEKYIKVKKPGSLKIDQMADYLGAYATDTGEVINGLELEEVLK